MPETIGSAPATILLSGLIHPLAPRPPGGRRKPLESSRDLDFGGVAECPAPRENRALLTYAKQRCNMRGKDEKSPQIAACRHWLGAARASSAHPVYEADGNASSPLSSNGNSSPPLSSNGNPFSPMSLCINHSSRLTCTRLRGVTRCRWHRTAAHVCKHGRLR